MSADKTRAHYEAMADEAATSPKYVVSGIGVRANRYFRAKGEIVYQPGQATHYQSHFHAMAAAVENEEVLEYDPVRGKLYFPVGQD